MLSVRKQGKKRISCVSFLHCLIVPERLSSGEGDESLFVEYFFQEDDLKNTFIIYHNLSRSQGTAAKGGKFLPPPFIIAIILSPAPSPHPLNITSPPACVLRCSGGKPEGRGETGKNHHIFQAGSI